MVAVVSIPTVYRIIRRGELDSFTVGRRRLVPWEALTAYITEQTQKGGAA